MPFYYACALGNTTANGTANTELDHLRLLTVANQPTCRVSGLFVVGQSATAGGIRLRVASFATPSTAGSAFTPAERRPDGPAASTTAFTAPTLGSTRTNHLTIGTSQVGGTGGWVALEEAHAINLLANGGANGNLDLISIATTASTPFDPTLEFAE